MKVVEGWDWTQNVYFDERNNFVEEWVLNLGWNMPQLSLIRLNWVKILTLLLKVVETRDKACKMYFDELSNFVGGTFFVRPLVFEIIEIIG